MPVLVRSRLRRLTPIPRRIETLAQAILAAVGESKAELSLELVGEGRMRRLNRRYRRRDGPTDVLAFPMRESASPIPSLLGDIVISVPTAARQAGAHSHGLDEEIAVLLVHGILHLCGYDHERSEREATRMFRKQRDILRRLGRIQKLLQSRDA